MHRPSGPTCVTRSAGSRASQRLLRLRLRNSVLVARQRGTSPATGSIRNGGRTVKLASHVRGAIDDLAKEILVRLIQELAEPIGDHSDSLFATLRELEREWRSFNAATTPLRRENDQDSPHLRIEAVLATLSVDQRDALFLHLGRGMPCAEIARQTGVSHLAVLNDLVRAYSRIRLLLADDDLKSIYSP